MDFRCNISATRNFLAKKHTEQQEKREQLFKKAQKDFNNIVQMIVRDYHPKQIFQWGSLLNIEKFNVYSDIDIDGDLTAEEYFELLKKAERLTSFPLDILLFKKIHPKHLEMITLKGKKIV
jgi:hypothetical protein